MAVKYYYSKYNSRRHWELWSEGQGRRTIEHILDGKRTTVAYLKTARLKVGAFEYKTVWEMYQDRYANRLGVYNSPEAAFKSFTGGF